MSRNHQRRGAAVFVLAQRTTPRAMSLAVKPDAQRPSSPFNFAPGNTLKDIIQARTVGNTDHCLPEFGVSAQPFTLRELQFALFRSVGIRSMPLPDGPDRAPFYPLTGFPKAQQL